MVAALCCPGQQFKSPSTGALSKTSVSIQGVGVDFDWGALSSPGLVAATGPLDKSMPNVCSYFHSNESFCVQSQAELLHPVR